MILDPSVPKVDPDHSLKRYPADSDTDTATDWREQSNPIPGQIDPSTPPPFPTPTATLTPSPLPPLIINEIHADPAGDLYGDGVRDPYDDGFLEIVNTTNENIGISGWTLNDSDAIRHTFPFSTTIRAGCSVLIFGGGTPNGDFGGALIQLASSGKPYLNNDGDTLTLQDNGSTVIDWHQYGTNANYDQSITRDPDITGPNPMVKHSLANGSSGALFSPGARIDASNFSGCPINAVLKSAKSDWKQ